MEVHNSSQGRAMSNSSTRLPSLSRRPSPQLPKLSSHQNGENRGVSQSTPVTPSFNKKNYPTMMSRTSLTPTANFYNNGATTQQWRSPGAPGFSSTPTNPVTGNRPKPNIPASPSLEASTLIDRLHKRDQVHFIKPWSLMTCDVVTETVLATALPWMLCYPMSWFWLSLFFLSSRFHWFFVKLIEESEGLTNDAIGRKVLNPSLHPHTSKFLFYIRI